MESLNAKINYYLPKKTSNNLEFVECLSKIFINSKLNDRDIIRHFYATKTLINLIDNFKLNDNPKWIIYNDYMEIHKRVIILALLSHFEVITFQNAYTVSRIINILMS